MHIPHYPSLPHSEFYRLYCGGTQVPVLFTGVADFAQVLLADAEESFEVRVEAGAGQDLRRASLSPRRSAPEWLCEGSGLRFQVAGPCRLALQPDGSAKPLYLFFEPPAAADPDLSDPGVFHIPPGETLETPRLDLRNYHTLHLPAGAVLRTLLDIRDKDGFRICGQGILDASIHDRTRDGGMQTLLLHRCNNLLIEEITLLRPPGWMIVPVDCEHVTIRHIKEIGEVISSDGIDVVGCRHVHIHDCFLHNNDDCVVIKALPLHHTPGGLPADGCRDVRDVRVERCVFANWQAGNAMEIGHELRADRVGDILFRDIDVLHVHGHGAVFSIANCDRALIENVRYEQIHIEHCYDKFINLRVTRSRYSHDETRGSIRNVSFRDIHWERTPYNAGYTISLLGGWDAEHPLENLRFENIYLDGQAISDLDSLQLHTRYVHGIHLDPGSAPELP